MKKPLKWAINEVRGLPTFASGRVALLGDAVSSCGINKSYSKADTRQAHAMTPHLASGAGQAVEVRFQHIQSSELC